MLGGHPAVGELDHAVGHRGDRRVVRDHHRRRAELAVDAFDRREQARGEGRARPEAEVVAVAAAVVTPIGLFFGRLANFINGELWGRPTDVPWAMRFENDPLGACRHPSQLYEAALEGVLIFTVINIATWKFRSLARPGMNAGLFLLIYGLSRALLEPVREPDRHMPEALQGYVTMGMLLSVPMIFIGAFLIWRAWKKGPAPAPAAA